MPPETPGVTVPATTPPAGQPGVTEPVVSPQQEPGAIQDEQPQVQPVPAGIPEDTTDWKARAFEWRRKTEDLAERLPQLIEDKLSRINNVQPQQYTFEQLEVWKQQNASDPNSVAWAIGEQRKIQLAEQRKMIEDVVGQRENVIREENIKQRALEYVQKNFPEAFLKDPSGRIVDWDVNSQFTQTLFGIMNDSRFKSHPEGLAAAADIAYGRLARSQSPLVRQKTDQLKSDIKTLQKVSLTEGSGRKSVPAETPQHSSIESLKKTGSIRDAEAAVGAILRSKGILVEG